ncbi:MAG: hypothetical protein KDD01_13520 [Phaeodactylibacter sp.]|nr:hypothetical protein [Phaeodactylibacter sp.]
MIGSFLIGIGGMIFLMAAWVIIQSLWRKSFSDYLSDEDVLADRASCGNCGCATACERKRKPIATE